MKNELLEQIKQEYAKENDYKNYQNLAIGLGDMKYLFEQTNDEIAHRYAQAYAKQKLEEAFRKIKNEVSTDIPESEGNEWDEGYNMGVEDSLHIINLVEKTIKEL